MTRVKIILLTCLLTVLSWSIATADEPPTEKSPADEPLANARRLLLEGKYAESAEIHGTLTTDNPAAVLGLARTMIARGETDDAKRTLQAGGEHADLAAELARLAWRRGDYPSAKRHVETALRLKFDQILARWIQAELARASGRLDEAEEGMAWLIRYYNNHEDLDSESLRWIGLAAAQYAQWNRLHEQYRFLVDEFYPGMLEREPGFWPAHYEAGRLLLEKFNYRDATKQFQAALALNPNAAEVHAAMARLAILTRDMRRARMSLARALEINPRLLEARWIEAELTWASLRPDETMRLLRDRLLPLNPRSEQTLGRLAACYVLVDGLPEVEKDTADKDKDEDKNGPAETNKDEDGTPSRFDALVDEVLAQNEHAGEFFFVLAEWLDARHRLFEAERFYQEARKRMPQQVGPAAALGMMWMHAGTEARARPMLEAALKQDPFNMRTVNLLSVLEVLDGMETAESEHVILKYAPEDKLLARYALPYLDKMYLELCEKFGYRPSEKPLIEIFHSGRGASGQQWFATRMTGLPYVGALAASTGMIVAMSSPSEGRFNWARVLTHEMVHVVTLQQTHFNIPRWYTEALAVQSEDIARPQSWNALLARRTNDDDLFDLDSIDLGFVRPEGAGDVQLAYCQSGLYADYLVAKYGPDAINKLLNAYADNQTTAEAIPRALSLSRTSKTTHEKDDTEVTQESFEQGYRAYVEEIVANLGGFDPVFQQSFAELLAAHRKTPDDAELAARTAYAYLGRGAYDEARHLAEKTIEQVPKHPLATYVLARIEVHDGQSRRATELLQGCLDPESPDMRVLNLLAALQLKAERYAEAARWYQLAARHEPNNLRWVRALALVHTRSKNTEGLAKALERLARAEADNLTARKELARMALERRDFAAAADWANQALWIDVQDMEVHQMFAEASVSMHNYDRGIEEFRVAIDLDPTAPEPRMGLADALVQAGQPDEARQVLEALLKLVPDYPGADVLLETLP